MAFPAKPTARAHNETEPPGTSIPLSTLFTCSGAAGDSVVFAAFELENLRLIGSERAQHPTGSGPLLGVGAWR